MKKPYSPPQIFEVELNQQQAILAVCSASASGLSSLGTSRCQTNSNCRRTSSGGNDSASAS